MTPKDLKILKRDYLSTIFPTIVIFLFIFLFVFIHSSLTKNFGIVFYTTTSVAFLLSIFFFVLKTKNHRLDLKHKSVLIETEMVENKVYKIDFEAGSSTVPVNVFSLLFFKQIFMAPMKQVHIYYILVNGEKFFLDKAGYEIAEIGKPILFRRTKHSRLFLGIEKVNEN